MLTDLELLKQGYKFGFSCSQSIVFGLALKDPRMPVNEANNLLSKLDDPISPSQEKMLVEFLELLERSNVR